MVYRLAVLAALSTATPAFAGDAMPDDFVYLHDVDPTIRQDMRYAGPHNFTGKPVDGYDARRMCAGAAGGRGAEAVQADLRAKSLTLKVYDCYRPARAVAAFVDWAKLPDDPKTKTTYYPNLSKSDLFPDYIATRSGHSRGATLDLTLVPIESSAPPAGEAKPRSCTAPQKGHAPDGSVAMGTSFDCFDAKANTAALGLSFGGAGKSRSVGRGDAGPRLQELPDGVVALHARARALSGHDLRLSDRAAAAPIDYSSR